MGYIEIPSIDCYLPIYHGTDNETLAKGVGHIEETSFPVGGAINVDIYNFSLLTINININQVILNLA